MAANDANTPSVGLVMRTVFVILVVACIACRKAPTARPAPANEVHVDKPDAALDRCAERRAATRRALTEASQRLHGDDDADTLVGWCAESPAGLWRIDMPSLTDVKDADSLRYALEARFTIVFEPASASPASYVPKERLAQYGQRTHTIPFTHDYDGDGVPELYVQVDEVGDEGHRARQIDLLTYHSGKVAPYEPSAKLDIASARDVDVDGTPDLLVYAGYEDPLESCAAGFPFDRPDALFVAHAHGGGFLLDDEVAKSHARSWCPSGPAKIASSTDAICARLWAKDVAGQRARVAASCTDWDCAAELASKPQPKSAAEDCARRRAFFDRTPPLTLP